VTRRALESAGVEFIDENRGPRRPRRSDRYSAACARASLGFIDENGGSPASVLVANNKRLFTARRLSALFWQNEPKIFMHFAALAYAGGESVTAPVEELLIIAGMKCAPTSTATSTR
jgi:hypothetical protein